MIAAICRCRRIDFLPLW